VIVVTKLKTRAAMALRTTREDTMAKKPYTQPTITDHGSVVEKTKGTMGETVEFMGWRAVIWEVGDDKKN